MTDSDFAENSKTAGLVYKDAGVDIDAGNFLVSRIKSVAQSTKRPEVLAGLGGFGALFELPKGYREPVLVSGTDGVGTKLKLAMDTNRHHTIGIDLVAMCVNDIVVSGAEPLFFLDYYATSKLSVDIATRVVEGIAAGCTLAGCSLVGGETAEMPGMYGGEDYDLAGFCVGIVEKSKILDGSQVSPGDNIIALTSSGPHANGYSLVRKIVDINAVDLSTPFGTNTLAEALLKPTRIYVKPLLSLCKLIDVRALAHITGGGHSENIPRVLPTGTKAVIDTNSWQFPEIFRWLQNLGKITTLEMMRTFNCGVGMVICVAQQDTSECLKLLKQYGENPFVIGEIAKSNDKGVHVEYLNLG